MPPASCPPRGAGVCGIAAPMLSCPLLSASCYGGDGSIGWIMLCGASHESQTSTFPQTAPPRRHDRHAYQEAALSCKKAIDGVMWKLCFFFWQKETLRSSRRFCAAVCVSLCHPQAASCTHVEALQTKQKGSDLKRERALLYMHVEQDPLTICSRHHAPTGLSAGGRFLMSSAPAWAMCPVQ